MEKDFHYHLTYSAVKLTGFERADVIAYSCQFVDDNNEGQFIVDKEDVFFPEKIPADGGHYYPMMTQSLSPKSLDCYVQKYVYIPFHFIPGDNTVVIGGMKNPLSTTPGSSNARSLLKAALNSSDPYRIGIALHSFADTWSHQNFTGLSESWNAIYPWYNVFKSIVPNIGHAEAGHSPDVISEEWVDYRFETKINNQERALDAIAEMYRTLREKSSKGPLWSDVAKDYKRIIGTFSYDKRIQLISDFVNDNNLGQTPVYSKDRWIDAALDRAHGKIMMRADFPDTDWYRFHQAAKAHFAMLMDLIKSV
jgi:hypothetical protein